MNVADTSTRATQRKGPRRPRAFTLIELLVVVAIIALLIAILLPSLNKAKEQTRLVVCLANKRAISQGVMVYVSEGRDVLPGPLHPAVYRNLSDYPNDWQKERMLLWKLRRVFKDTTSKSEDGVTDKVATCPTAGIVNPDQNITAYNMLTGNQVKPTHYVLNNWSISNGSEPAGPTEPTPRGTNPPYYFGYSDPGNNPANDTAPQPLSRIPRASAEWMLADAWYRWRPGAGNQNPPPPAAPPPPVQEGTYQSAWSGKAFPNFAPHGRRTNKGYLYSQGSWDTENVQIRSARADGKTNTAFFDGHAESVTSKVVTINGFEIFYGFKGTVNPANGWIWPQQ